MLIQLATHKSISQAATDLDAAVQANHFGVMQVLNFKEIMVKKGVDFIRECLIFEVCQPQQTKKVFNGDMRISTALPCRISIFEEAGQTIIATIKPTKLLAMFGVSELEPVTQEVEDTMIKIITAAAYVTV